MATRPHTPIPRLTSRIFRDLAIWMAGMGLAIGVVFPVLIIPLGIPARLSIRPAFYVATVVAGLLLGTLSHQVARLVVGRRLRELAERMGYVAGVIEQATYSGDWSRCTPEDCALDVDSADELGEAAEAFNRLLQSLAASRAVEDTLSAHGRLLAGHLDLDALAVAAVDGLVDDLDATAGALCVVIDGELSVVADRQIDPDQLVGSAMVRESLRGDEIVVVRVPPDVVVDAAAVSFRPAAVVVAPLRSRGQTLGALVLAFDEVPGADALRLLDSLCGPTAVALHNAVTHDRFQRLAAIDPLTGVYNRRFGFGRLAEEYARSLRSSSPLGLLVLDLDHFKQVNDVYGHLVGDQVLRDVAMAARTGLREGDVLVRTGGEEFVVILPGAGTEDVRVVGERIRRLVGGLTVDAGGAALSVTASFGGVSFPDADVASPDELVELADRAMYWAKQGGRDQVRMAAGELAGHAGT